MTDFNTAFVVLSLAMTGVVGIGVLVLRPVESFTLAFLVAVLYLSPLLVAEAIVLGTEVVRTGVGVDGVYDVNEGKMRLGIPEVLVLLLLLLDCVPCCWERGVAVLTGVREGVAGVGVHLGI